MIADESPVIPKITRINNMGKVIIAFSEPMKSFNYTNITNGNFEANDVSWPALAITMKPYDEDKTIKFSWKCTNYTSSSLELQLNFTHPNEVSYQRPRDKIQVTFWGQTYFVS